MFWHRSCTGRQTLAVPQSRNTPPAPAAARGDAPIARSFTGAKLPDGTECEIAREGDWVYARLPGGKEGRLSSRRFDSFMRAGRVRRAGPGEAVRPALVEAMRLSAWSIVGFVVLILVVLAALLLVSIL
jgi:hypothetical protein